MYRPLRRSIRNKKGQAIIEGAVVLWLITFLVVMGVLLILFTGFALYYKIKMSFVAQQVAAFMQNRANFIGVPRPVGTGPGQFDLSGTTVQAKALGNTLLTKFGLPAVSDDAITIVQPSGGSSIWEVTIVEDKIPIPFGGGFVPAIIKLSETGLSVENTQDLFAYSLITVVDPQGGPSRGMVVPVMAFTQENKDFDEASALSCKFGFDKSIFGIFNVSGSLQPTGQSGTLFFNKPGVPELSSQTSLHE
jgi:hypothetical protein